MSQVKNNIENKNIEKNIEKNNEKNNNIKGKFTTYNFSEMDDYEINSFYYTSIYNGKYWF